MYIHLGINYKWIKSVPISNRYTVIKIEPFYIAQNCVMYSLFHNCTMLSNSMLFLVWGISNTFTCNIVWCFIFNTHQFLFIYAIGSIYIPHRQNNALQK